MQAGLSTLLDSLLLCMYAVQLEVACSLEWHAVSTSQGLPVTSHASKVLICILHTIRLPQLIVNLACLSSTN